MFTEHLLCAGLGRNISALLVLILLQTLFREWQVHILKPLSPVMLLYFLHST